MGGKNSGGKPFNEKGNRYGHWLVIGERTRGSEYVLCHCDCGTECQVKVNNLRAGVSTRCAICTNTPERRAKQSKFMTAYMKSPKHRKKVSDRLLSLKLINPRRKLTMEQAQEIRALYQSGTSCTSLAKQYGVSHGAVWMIIKGRTYKQ